MNDYPSGCRASTRGRDKGHLPANDTGRHMTPPLRPSQGFLHEDAHSASTGGGMPPPSPPLRTHTLPRQAEACLPPPPGRTLCLPC